MPEFKNYEKLLWMLAHRHSHKTGRDVEELFAVASLAFVSSTKAWAKQRRNTVKFSTFLTKMVYFEYNNEGLQYRRRVRVAREHRGEYAAHFCQTTAEVDPEQQTLFRHGLARLSKDAQAVVRAVFDSPEELTRLSKTSLTTFFQTRGWAIGRSKAAFEEISGMLA